MSKQVKIMSGVSGCGKSTLTSDIIMSSDAMSIGVYSADTYFMRSGSYKFDPSNLGEAHGQCFKNFIEALQRGLDLVVVDNTNTTSEEIAPYVLGAQAFGYDVEIITISVTNDDDLQKCIVRNKHGVLAGGIIAQQQRILTRQFPPWWNARTVEAKF